MARFVDFLEVERQMVRAERDLLTMQNATAAKDVRNAWEDFLAHWHGAIERLIELAEGERNAQAIALQIKVEKGKKGNPAISYCLSLRNVVVHRLDSAIKSIKNRTTVSGNAIAIEGDNNVSIGSLTVDGLKIGGNIFICTKDGLPVHVKGLECESVEHEFDMIELPETVTNFRKTKTYIRPTELNGKELKADGFAQLGQYALAWARSHLKAVKAAV